MGYLLAILVAAIAQFWYCVQFVRERRRRKRRWAERHPGFAPNLAVSEGTSNSENPYTSPIKQAAVRRKKISNEAARVNEWLDQIEENQ
ncbi:MAG TPA: hypothetical protein VKB78_02450 [Pirellulales bacterium]|nr:hypothetical protein [Pirellulales bacterium]